MNKQIFKGFNEEMQKEALLPVSWIKGLTKLKIDRAARIGEKNITREAGRILSKAGRTGGKELARPAGGYQQGDRPTAGHAATRRSGPL